MRAKGNQDSIFLSLFIFTEGIWAKTVDYKLEFLATGTSLSIKDEESRIGRARDIAPVLFGPTNGFRHGLAYLSRSY